MVHAERIGLLVVSWGLALAPRPVQLSNLAAQLTAYGREAAPALALPGRHDDRGDLDPADDRVEGNDGLDLGASAGTTLPATRSSPTRPTRRSSRRVPGDGAGW